MTLTRLAIAGTLVAVGAVATAAGGLAIGMLRADDPRPARVQQKARDRAASIPTPASPAQ